MFTKQVIVMRKDLNMRKGKIAAQAAHASLGIFTQYMQITGVSSYDCNLFLGSFPMSQEAKNWFESSFTKICVSVDSEAELLRIYGKAVEAGLPHILIVDNGATEFNGVPTNTCIGIGPAESSKIDEITGHLKLY